jgi:hypothetical protein
MVVVAIILGVAAQLVQGFRGPRTSFDGVIVGAVALGFGLFVGALKPYGPRWDGLYIVPAIIAAVVWAGIAAWLLRYLARPYQPVE